MKTHRILRLLPILALLAPAAACQMLLTPGAFPNANGKAADNPLSSGKALENKSNARDIGVVSANDCSTWPFEDAITVNASEAEICVSYRKHRVQMPGWTGEPTSDSSKGFSVSTDDSKSNGYVNAKKEHASKVGTCFDKGYQKQVGIWAFDYKGCAKNETLTRTSAWLRVGDDQWSFPTAKPATSEGKTASNGS